MTGAICICHKQFSYPEMWTSLAGLVKPKGTAILTAEGTLIAGQRTQLAKAALDAGAEWVLFVDDDHLLPAGGLMRLLSWDEPVVGGHYVTRRPPYKSTAHCIIRWEGDRPFYAPLDMAHVAADGLELVDGLGMGFTLIRRAAFDAVAFPWFQLGQQSTQEVGEDTYFCAHVRKAGLPVYVDVGLQIPHLATKAVTYVGGGQVKSLELADAMAREGGLAPRAEEGR